MKTAITLVLINISILLGVDNSASSAISLNDHSYYTEVSAQLPLEEEPLSQDYEVWVNGIKAKVYVARVQDPPWDKTQLDHGGEYSFTSFDVSKPVEIKIQSKIVGNGYRKNFINLVIRPDNIKIKNFINKNNEITFTIDSPVKLIIEPDGKNGPLMVFANPVNQYIPDRDNKNLIYFGPGIHKPDSALIRVRDNQTLYLDEGAVVKAGVIVSGNNTTICGRGILCGNEFVWGKGARNMLLITGNNVVVKDIIIRGAATWTIPLRNCHNIVIDNIKILGGRAQNDDGINPINAQDVLIKNCFLRTDDDCIAMKGMQSPPNNKNVERITIENTILWCDKAKTILLGHESRAEYMRDIKFQNIDIVHMGHHSFVLEPGEEMKLENVIFENIRINGNGQKDLLSIRPVINQYMRTKVPGHINNIIFKNITVTGIAGKYGIWLAGADENHSVSGVTFTNFSVSGEKIMKESKYLKVDNWVHSFYCK